MPEGDTVWKLARRLDRALQGQQLVLSDFRVPRLATRDLTGRTVLEHDTHGKHLLTRFDGEITLHSHLLMDGSWSLTGAGKQLPRRLMRDVRLVLGVASGATAYAVRVHQLDLVATRDEHRLVGRLGPDPLRPDWDAAEAVRRLEAAPATPLVSALLDQTLMAGLGNMWVNEVAFLVGRSPWTPIGEVDVPAVVRLAHRALTTSVTVPGGYQVTTGSRRPGEERWVYGREGRPCLRCGTRVRGAEALTNDPANRRTSWCPACQPGPGPEGRTPTRPGVAPSPR